MCLLDTGRIGLRAEMIFPGDLYTVVYAFHPFSCCWRMISVTFSASSVIGLVRIFVLRSEKLKVVATFLRAKDN